MLRTIQTDKQVQDTYEESSDSNLQTQPSNPNLCKRARSMTPPKVESPGTNCKRLAIKTRHLYNTVAALKHIETMSPLPQEVIKSKEVDLEKKSRGGKTVIFDLDETLIHCVMDPNKAEVAIPLQLPTGEKTIVGFNIRPYAMEVLEAASQLHEVIVFTASAKAYADCVLDYLDPCGTLIHHRLYRSSCILTQGVYIKDLRILKNRKLEDTIIIDNSAYSFAFQIDNGIPIIEWKDDRTDRELYNLIGYLRMIVKEGDVREINQRAFKLNTFKSR